MGGKFSRERNFSSTSSCCVIFVKKKTPMSEKKLPALILLSPVREPNIRRKLLKERSSRLDDA